MAYRRTLRATPRLVAASFAVTAAVLTIDFFGAVNTSPFTYLQF